MKIGLLFCAYGVPEYVEQSINPWINLKDELNIKIATVHGQFKENHENNQEDNDVETQNKLYSLLLGGKIDYLYCQNHYGVDFASDLKKYETEAQIRNHGLQYLLGENVDYVILWDLDEQATEQEIKNLIAYINRPENKFYCWFGIEYKNLVFTENQYIEGFCPPRVFKVNINAYKIKEVFWDNDLSYQGVITRDIKSYKDFASKAIQKQVIWPKHYTWLSNERSKNKVKYQLAHFKTGCSYKWNDIENKLEFDLDFYRKTGQTIPEVKNI